MTKHEQYLLHFQKLNTAGGITNICDSTDKDVRVSILCGFLTGASAHVTSVLINSLEYALNGNSHDGFWGEVGGYAVEFYENNTVELMDSGVFYPMEDLKEILQEWLIFITRK